MPNLAWTWTTLNAALQSWPKNSSTEYTNDIASIVGLGERRLVRDLNLDLFDREDASVSTVIGTRTLAKATNAIVVRDVSLVVASVYTPLDQRSVGYCRHYAPNATVQATPRYWADYDKDTLYVVPTPSAVVTVVQYASFLPTDSLSSVTPNATSWLSTRVADALFCACLMEAEHHLKADDRYGDMKTKYYQELLPSARIELRNLIRRGDYAPLPGTPRTV